ncbi:MAG: HAD-IA family hydrolase [Hydrogenophilales bacterium]|nr:HAD-IA family hydrolase [Hydrogenophilales bacterium]
MSKRFELLIFDWDGTLMDSAGVIVQSIQAACVDLGWPVPSREAASHIIGLGLKEAVADLFPELPASEHPQLVERYRHHFLSQDRAIPLFEGARELVEEMHARGHTLAVATGKARLGLARAFEHTGMGGYFHATRTADVTFSKPHPAMILELLDELMMAPEQTLMIGDTSHDLEMARNAGVASLAAGYGAHPGDSLAEYGPLAICRDFGELAKWLRANA